MAAVDAQAPVAEGIIGEKMESMELGKNGTTTAADALGGSTQSSSVAASLREKPSGVIKTPFLEPASSAKPKPRVDLTSEQEDKYNALLDTVKSWKEIPSTTGKGGHIVESEIMWLTRECLLRYLRATKWVTADAAKRILATLSWRRDYDVESLLDGEIVSPENETGKQNILGYDVDARPCLYLNPGLQNTAPSPRQVQHLVFMLERVIDMMIPGQDSLALLINFKANKSRTNTSPGISTGREVLNILQTHYPERLGRACIINGRFSSFPDTPRHGRNIEEGLTFIIVPWVVWGFFKLITPFIDPLTREKLKFNEDVRLYVPPEQLWKENGGDVDFQYDHAVYWPALIKLCDEKRAVQKQRWEKAGKRYGESEAYIKGGDLGAPAAVSTEISQAETTPAQPGQE